MTLCCVPSVTGLEIFVHVERGATKRRKGLQIDVLNTANSDKGLDNPNLTLM